MFGYIYPSERDRLPSWVMHTLIERLQAALAAPPPAQRICRGTLLSRQQYLHDVQAWGYLDPRAEPDNPMTDAEIATWTAGIAADGATDTN
jgi:hypothetical protein